MHILFKLLFFLESSLFQLWNDCIYWIRYWVVESQLDFCFNSILFFEWGNWAVKTVSSIAYSNLKSFTSSICEQTNWIQTCSLTEVGFWQMILNLLWWLKESCFSFYPTVLLLSDYSLRSIWNCNSCYLITNFWISVPVSVSADDFCHWQNMLYCIGNMGNTRPIVYIISCTKYKLRQLWYTSVSSRI